ncbi:MAG: hypothetical protein K2J34_01025 [Muribaculaceae bacterium]|nr:hypothetical protein [Muribaculaceae bacterium]
MKSFVYNILFLISSLFCICSCSNGEDIPLEYEEFSTLDLGEGTYRPNPFPFLDKLPPFSWMGMPDSVKLKTTLQIGFNEDAIRSNSTAKLAFLDNNGNIVEGLTYDGHDYSYVEIDASDLGYDQVAIVPIEITVDPSLGNRELNGSIAVFDADVDVVNQQTLTSSPQAVASWSLTQHTGINWLRWLIFIIEIGIALGLIYIIGRLIITLFIILKNTLYSFLEKLSSPFRSSKAIINNKELNEDFAEEEIEEEGYGRKITPTKFLINRNYIIPSGNQHKNPYEMTCGEILDALGDYDRIITLGYDSEPIFNKDGGTSNGKPLEVKIPGGIGRFLKKKSNGKIERRYLHDEAFRLIAKKYGMDEDQLQVFKGNSAPITKLMNKWNCSEQEVYDKCGNPFRIPRALHECKDCETVQLVPWVYHHLHHYGGIEAYKSKYM